MNQHTRAGNHGEAMYSHTSLGGIEYRRAGTARRLSHVLLHGIGSGSQSWVNQLQAAASRDDALVLAWEAPGYGISEPVSASKPTATDYAQRMWCWIDALATQGMDTRDPFTLVGHSLGALIAAAAAAQRTDAIAKLVLLSPARGYGQADASTRENVIRTRLNNLEQLGPLGMAQARVEAMLSPRATHQMREWVAHIMAQIQPSGYRQAVHMLAQEDLLAHLGHADVPKHVASGESDGITPASGCQALAKEAHAPWQSLGPVGHVCALEAPEAVNAILGLSPPVKPLALP